MKKNNSLMSFSSAYVKKRTSRSVFYHQINKIIDWQVIEIEINKSYSIGKSAVGVKAYSGILLFKMLLVGIWNGNLSDRLVEEMVNENLSAMDFCGLQLEDTVPDHSCLSRFRSSLAKNNAFESILDQINNQLEAHQIMIKTGVKIDASITESPRKPKGKMTYLIAEDRREDEVSEEDKQNQAIGLQAIKLIQPGVDQEARWLKKGRKTHYGYKEHIATDENGLVLSLETKKHDQILTDRKLKNRIHHKAVKNKPLTNWQKKFNSRLSSFRYTVERTFGSKVLWFNAGVARYVGIIKTHSQHILESIAYNLKRSPNLKMQQEAKNQLLKF